MFEFQRKASCLVHLQFINQIGRLNVMAGYLLGCFYSMMMTVRYVSYSGGLEVQFLEGFLLVTGTWGEMSVLILGYFLIMAGAPFVDNTAQFIITRGGNKKVWLYGTINYLFLQTLLYWGAVLISGMIPCLFVQCSGTNEWSRVMRIIANIQSERKIVEFGLPNVSASVLTQWLPWKAAGLSFMLAVCYSGVIGVIMVLFNLCSDHPLGSMLALGVHFVGTILIKSGWDAAVKLSLLANALLDYHTKEGMTLGYSFGFFGLLLFLLSFAFIFLGDKVDYRIANGDRHW